MPDDIFDRVAKTPKAGGDIFDRVAHQSQMPAGSYQARKGGPVVKPGTGEEQDASGLKDIVPIQGEEFADTMKRAIAYGKTLKPEDIQRQQKTDLRRAPAALAAGPAMAAAQLAAPIGVGSLFAPAVGEATVGTGILDAGGSEVMKDVATQGPSMARAGVGAVINAVKSHPIISSYIGTHLANELGIPLPKILKALAGI